MYNPLKQFTLRLAMAAGLAASAASAHAQSASATISGVAAGGGIFDYTIVLKNTSPSISLEGFWYAWTIFGNNLSAAISNPGSTLGWTDTALEGNTSISWQGNSGDALAAGQSATFTFDSTETPTAITAGSSGESVAYVGNIDFSQGSSGDSTGVFSPVLTVAPEPSSIALLAAGAALLVFSVRYRTVLRRS
jgi:hypothetical protein